MIYFRIIFPFVLVRLVMSEFKLSSTSGDGTYWDTSSLRPWLGVLRVSRDPSLTDAVTIITLIGEKLAIGNSNDISTIDKKTMRNQTKILFWYSENSTLDAFLDDYILHPEFDSKTINTIALLELTTQDYVPHNMWHPIAWPKRRFNPVKQKSLYNFGFTDRKKVFQQTVNTMDYVNAENCSQFYKKEQIDFSSIRPVKHNCFISTDQNDTCIHDSGMTLASNSTGKWELIGISTYGPGCNLPARFIDVYSYLPWIKNNRRNQDIHYSRNIPFKTRRSGDSKEQFSGNYWLLDPVEKFDTVLLLYLSDDSVVLKKAIAGVEEVPYGKCTGFGRNVYREEGHFAVKYDATVLYSVTLWDSDYEKLQCIRTKVNCSKRSETTVIMRYGFGQDDTEEVVKEVPFVKIDGSKKKKIPTIQGQYLPYGDKPTITIWLKFQFHSTADVYVDFVVDKRSGKPYG